MGRTKPQYRRKKEEVGRVGAGGGATNTSKRKQVPTTFSNSMDIAEEEEIMLMEMPDVKFDDDVVEVVPLSKNDIAEQRRAIGNVHYKSGEYKKALENYTGAIALDPTQVSFYGNRAACYMMMKRYQEALADTHECLKIDPNYEKSYLRMIRINLALGDLVACDSAILHYSTKKFNTNISSEREKLIVLKTLKSSIEIEISRSQKNFRRLLYLCDQALDIANVGIDVMMSKGFALVELGRYKEAKKMATKVMTIDGHNVDAHVILALYHYQLDNMDESLSFFKGALQHGPKEAGKHSLLYRQVNEIKETREIAAKLFVQEKYEESKALYLDCIKIITSEGNLRNTYLEAKFSFKLSLIFNKQRMFEDATDYATKALEINPSYYKAFVHRATIHNSRGMYDEAVRDWEAALLIDPSRRELKYHIQMTAKKAKRKNYYKILDIPEKATDDDIRKAYKKKAKLHHPDRHAGETQAVQKEQEQIFKDVGEAHEILLDKLKRSRYDNVLDEDEDNNGDGARFYNAGGRGGGYNF